MLALAQKFAEEAKVSASVVAESPGSLATWIADLYVIVVTLIAIHNLDRNVILSRRAGRRHEYVALLRPRLQQAK